MVSLVRAIAVHGHHIQNDGVMDHAVNGSHGGHRIFENAFPFAEHQIRGDHHRFAFIALSQERKEHLHFVAIMLDVANIIENDTGKLVQFRQLLRQTQVPLWRPEAAAQACWWASRARDRPATITFIPNCGQAMTFTPSIEMPS